MSEEKKIFCTECGTENTSNSKFCSNCGSKLEVAPVTEEVVEAPVEEAPVFESAAENVYSGDTTPYSSDYTEAPVVEETPAEEINISYSQEDSGSFSSSAAYDSQPQYYAADPVVEKVGGGNKGFAIASMVCGILSVVCCCLGCFSLVLALVAIGLGIVTLACKYDGKGMAIAGIVLGGFGVLFFIATIFIGASEGYTEMMDEIMSELY